MNNRVVVHNKNVKNKFSCNPENMKIIIIELGELRVAIEFCPKCGNNEIKELYPQRERYQCHICDVVFELEGLDDPLFPNHFIPAQYKESSYKGGKRDWLVEFRKKNKMTQLQMAQKWGINLSRYQNYEYGRRTPKVPIARMAGEKLGLDWMLFFED